MDKMQFAAALVSSLAWPLAVVVIVCLLRRSIVGLLPKIRSLKYGDLHIDLGVELKAVEADLTTGTAQSDLQPTPTEDPAALHLAAEAPQAAILHSWFEVESAIDSLVTRLDWKFSSKYNNPRIKMQLLFSKGHIDELTLSTFKKLASIRNDAVHLSGRELDFDDAVSMSTSCKWLVEKLEAVKSEDPLV